MGQVENRRVESHGYKVYVVSQVFRALYRTSCVLFSPSSFSISRYCHETASNQKDLGLIPSCPSILSLPTVPQVHWSYRGFVGPNAGSLDLTQVHWT